MEDKIRTRHPAGKAGRHISKKKYDTLKQEILSLLANGELTHKELFDRMNENLRGSFDGNISWYGETVKLDLEARNTIERTHSKPQRYRLRD